MPKRCRMKLLSLFIKRQTRELNSKLCKLFACRNLDTSVPSLHSSGRDSGLDLSRERSESPSKQIVRIMRDSQVRTRNGTKRKKCTCGHAEQHRCSGDESRSVKRRCHELGHPKLIRTRTDFLTGFTKVFQKFGRRQLQIFLESLAAPDSGR